MSIKYRVPVLLFGMLLFSSCSTVRVNSNPRGANVFIDGKDTGKCAPTGFQVRSLPTDNLLETGAESEAV